MEADSEMDYSEIVAFHGHSCPGLAMGYRMVAAAMAELGITRSSDEEIVAIVENDACGVDALQYVSGCTFGKGNLVFRDYGKNVYTLLSRRSGHGVRVVFHGRGVPEGLRDDRTAYAEYLKVCPEESIIERQPVSHDLPAAARIRNSAVCQYCGEFVMENRLQHLDGQLLCIPCSEL
jgi:formylmethanofuran dehydrogenase subunit E